MESPSLSNSKAPMSPLDFGIDLITFFHPGFWNLESESDVIAYGMANPRPFWDRMLDTLDGTGITGIELTFAPFGWTEMVRAYGSAAGVQAALDGRGLKIASGFFADVAIEGRLDDAEQQASLIDRAEKYAAFLAEMGAELLVMGLPMRSSWNQKPPVFVDLPMAAAVADFCNRLGAATLRHGVRLALHTEAHSIFSLPRDVDLIMTLTDPVYVGFCPDTAHLLLGGADPVAVVERHIDRVILAHWKDATGSMPLYISIDETIHQAHRPYFCALGSGRVDWQRWARLMRDRDVRGWAVLEIDAVADPGREIRRSLDYVNTCLRPIFG
ncbi:Sugar phosphate isomerase/epimerase [Azospirillum sp. RU38E]|nr:Sugar phosphate isomerase/epimerase [Azospirillum sp. RU38E]SNS85414.1 Sugar phosphate isomerase/epimerase [Azospirillum sp. RU37A]